MTDTYQQNEYFDKNFTFTANEVADDPNTVVFTLIAPDSTSTSYTYLTDSQVSRVSEGVYNVRLQLSGDLGAYAYTMVGTWTGTPGNQISAGALSLVASTQIDFHYTPEAVDAVTRVRYYTGDTVEAEAQFTDSEIAMLISEEGGYQGAVISALEGLLVKINRQPDMAADWLRVAWGGSREGLENQLARLKLKWGKGYRRSGRRKSVKRYDTRASNGSSELEDLLDDLYS